MPIKDEDQLEKLFNFNKTQTFNKFKTLPPSEDTQLEKLWNSFVVNETLRMFPPSGEILNLLETKLDELEDQHKSDWISDLKSEQLASQKQKSSWQEKEKQRKENKDHHQLPPK